MDKGDFEGSIVLEKLAEIDQLDSFYEAIDADDLVRAKQIMKQAGLDADTIAIVLEMMED